MTNVRVVLHRDTKNGVPFDVLDIKKTNERKNRKTLTDTEIGIALQKADKIENTYFKLRVKAVIALATIFGKRRSEIASITLNKITIEDGFLIITFVLRKKHKKGLHQYLKFLEKTDPAITKTKPLDSIKLDWTLWQKTDQGIRVKTVEVTKKVSISEDYVIHILTYLEFLKENYPEATFLFPSGRQVFENYVVYGGLPIQPQSLLNALKKVAPSCWLHLFREKKGASICRSGGMNLETIFKVQQTLDLANETTAFAYIKRYGIQTVSAEKT